MLHKSKIRINTNFIVTLKKIKCKVFVQISLKLLYTMGLSS